ncbi:hypothetical protein M427DRAFT_452359 [Gonapodya prolifera JEL478]|uniref:Uncharacterized protein n=1 Tax=Gonapodya prolifera (strain JEL478) TaxID=1344416 RepID=A0A139ASQ6_GONPJ|nr:hypothetical protein M427DRAFT_452359 [Gonapodya prolifera JEL478]|eukprot:KXS19515.1 hypothetical protein M427DRAFT_452359 [Gonapodya prolifera JEL478]
MSNTSLAQLALLASLYYPSSSPALTSFLRHVDTALDPPASLFSISNLVSSFPTSHITHLAAATISTLWANFVLSDALRIHALTGGIVTRTKVELAVLGSAIWGAWKGWDGLAKRRWTFGWSAWGWLGGEDDKGASSWRSQQGCGGTKLVVPRAAPAWSGREMLVTKYAARSSTCDMVESSLARLRRFWLILAELEVGLATVVMSAPSYVHLASFIRAAVDRTLLESAYKTGMETRFWFFVPSSSPISAEVHPILPSKHSLIEMRWTPSNLLLVAEKHFQAAQKCANPVTAPDEYPSASWFSSRSRWSPTYGTCAREFWSIFCGFEQDSRTTSAWVVETVSAAGVGTPRQMLGVMKSAFAQILQLTDGRNSTLTDPCISKEILEEALLKRET